jgi:predicted PurR-regulated permease PerM
MDTKNPTNSWWLASIAILLVLAAFLWTSFQVLSPLLIGGILLFLLAGIKQFPFAKRLIWAAVLILLVWFLYKIQGMLFPFIMAFVFAFLFDPVANWLEKKHIPRTLVSLLLILVTIGLLVTVGLLLVPSLIEEIQQLISKVPTLSRQISHFIQLNLPKVLEFLRIDSDEMQKSLLDEVSARWEPFLSNLLKGVTGIGTFLSKFFNVILIPILTYYFLKDFDGIKRWLLDYVPRNYRHNVYFYGWRLNRILGGYIRGQIIVSSIVGLLTGLGLALFGIPFAVLLGVMSGLLNVIPYIGLYVSLGLSLLTGFFTANPLLSMLKIGGVFLIVQSLEAYVFSPKILGKRVGLHPLAVIASILIFSRFFGFWGLILGVPSAALIKFLLDEWKRHRKWREMRDSKIGSSGDSGSFSK